MLGLFVACYFPQLTQVSSAPPLPDILPITTEALLADLQSLAAESMGWQPLGEGAYLHHGAKDNPQAEPEAVIHVVGIPDTALAGLNVLLLT